MKMQKISDRVTVVHIGMPRLDVKTAQTFRDSTAAVQAESAAVVVLDLQGVEFIDSTGLGCLLSLFRMLRAKQTDMRLANLSEQVQAMFRLVRMNKIFDIFDSVEAASKI